MKDKKKASNSKKNPGDALSWEEKSGEKILIERGKLGPISLLFSSFLIVFSCRQKNKVTTRIRQLSQTHLPLCLHYLKFLLSFSRKSLSFNLSWCRLKRERKSIIFSEKSLLFFKLTVPERFRFPVIVVVVETVEVVIVANVTLLDFGAPMLLARLLDPLALAPFLLADPSSKSSQFQTLSPALRKVARTKKERTGWSEFPWDIFFKLFVRSPFFSASAFHSVHRDVVRAVGSSGNNSFAGTIVRLVFLPVAVRSLVLQMFADLL